MFIRVTIILSPLNLSFETTIHKKYAIFPLGGDNSLQGSGFTRRSTRLFIQEGKAKILPKTSPTPSRL